MSYVSAQSSPPGCVFCSALAAGDDRRTLILHRGRLAFLILNAYPYAPGHLMAAICRHGCALDEATGDELTEAMALVQQGIRALRAIYRPHGFNVGLNQGRVAGAGVPDHLHLHVVPRWDGDTSFMAVIGETKVLPETLETTYERLTAALIS
ncbi:MAG TPA: HIT domain-containing protein [Candidatus Methylomirabilis sp.]|nr:HIT domain-containing protein [Candidatus Methylomirabilis sp.]